jgi:hypothetical protein
MTAALLLLPSLLGALPADVAFDERLQQPVTLSIQNQPLDQAMRLIARAAGTPVEAVSSMWDLKVSVFCKDEPLGPVLARVADVLNAEWARDGDLLRLRMSAEEQRHRQAYLEAEDRLLRSAVESELRLFAQAARPNPNVRAGESERLGRIAGDPHLLALGTMFSRFNSGQSAAFWRGEVQTWAPSLPAAPFEIPQPDDGKRVFARFDPWTGGYWSRPEDGARTVKLVPYASPPEELGGLPFAKALAEWAKPEVPADTSSKTVVAPRRAAGGERYRAAHTLSDLARLAHEATGVAVVADSFRVPLPPISSGAMSLPGLSSALEGASFGVRFEDGVLALRHPGFWRLRRFEIPESAVRPHETLAEEEPLSLDEYVRFYMRLTPAQAAAVAVPDAVVLPFDPEPLVTLGPVLRLLGSLNPQQGRLALNPGLNAAEMTPAQRPGFVQALLYGGMQTGQGAALCGQAATGQLGELGLLIAETADESGRQGRGGRKLVDSRTFSVLLGRGPGAAVALGAKAKGP